MQERDGTFTQLSEKEVGNLRPWQLSKTICEGQIFKVKKCCFQVTEITKKGIVAKGISRKEYHDLKRGRPDWC